MLFLYLTAIRLYFRKIGGTPPPTDFFWLQEDGSFWLQEDGSKIII